MACGCAGVLVAEPVRIRRLTDQEGQRLQLIVRRGCDLPRTGVSYVPHRLGWSPQVPVPRAAEHDAEAVATWAKGTWPEVEQPCGSRTRGSSSKRSHSTVCCSAWPTSPANDRTVEVEHCTEAASTELVRISPCQRPIHAGGDLGGQLSPCAGSTSPAAGRSAGFSRSPVVTADLRVSR
ncbi:helix-turn-helix domain-containing protein [Kibdelosporangium persicum]|uniref:helix-turn-helix domain-containing protein n=1 Tax=Kibdelosporangium persicum TaxID=2698649 RepID=UPI0035E41C08